MYTGRRKKKKALSFEFVPVEDLYGNQKNSVVSSESSKLANSEGDVVKLVTAERRQMDKMIKNQSSKFGYLITSVFFAKNAGTYQSFTRGRAKLVLQNCTDYWDGSQIQEITSELRKALRQQLYEW